jgi:hypothetical protein
MFVWLTSLLAVSAFVGAGVGFLAREIRRRRQKRSAAHAFRPGQYCVAQSLLTEAERSFYGVLAGLELPGMKVFVKVRLADVFLVRQPKEATGWWATFGAISQKHVDFLLVRESDARAVMGIELDDGSHKRADRLERDRFVRSVFSDSGLPLLRVPAKRVYSPALVRRWVYDAAPLNFPLSGFVETLTTAMQPNERKLRVREAGCFAPASDGR